MTSSVHRAWSTKHTRQHRQQLSVTKATLAWSRLTTTNRLEFANCFFKNKQQTDFQSSRSLPWKVYWHLSSNPCSLKITSSKTPRFPYWRNVVGPLAAIQFAWFLPFLMYVSKLACLQLEYKKSFKLPSRMSTPAPSRHTLDNTWSFLTVRSWWCRP